MNIKDITTLEKVAQSYKCDIDTLINLAAQGKFPVFIAANNWYAHIWKSPTPYSDFPVEIIESDTGCEVVLQTPFEKIIASDIGYVMVRDTPLQNPIPLNHEFLELKKNSLQAYLLKKPNDADIGAFEVDRKIQWPDDYYFEYRLCNPSDFSKPHHIKLSEHTMVVRNCDLEIIERLLPDIPTLQSTELKESERIKLLKIIGVLSVVISESATKYRINDKPNELVISKSMQTVIDNIKKEYSNFEEYGIGDTTRRKALSEGYKELYKFKK